jgi:hypothetical protein
MILVRRLPRLCVLSALECARPEAWVNCLRGIARPRERAVGSIIALAAGLSLFPSTARTHARWDNGEPVPAWVKTECCGPTDAHHLRPDQVRRNAAGDYVVDIYPDPIPAHIALPSQDGDYWLFFYNDYGFYGIVRCFFVPALF